MTALIFLGFVVLGVVLDRLWLWARAADQMNTARFNAAVARYDIADRRRRAEEQMHRLIERHR